MSKLYANVILKEYEIGIETAREKMKSMPVRMKYVKSTKSFTITCFNIFLFIKHGGEDKEKVSVSEQDLMRLIKADTRWTEYDKKDLSKDSRYIKEVEKNGTDLAINHYWAICFIQRYFTLTLNTIKEAKREYHKYKLKRVDEPWIELSPIPANRHGGRPFGSVKKMTEEEHERLLYNLGNYEMLVKKYVEKDFLDAFVELHQDLRKLPSEELPDLLKRKFIRTDAGIKWYFCALRYEFKINLGIPDKKINPNKVAITKKSQTYDFPFKYKRDSLDFDELIENYDKMSEEYVKNGQIDEFVKLHKDLGKCERLPTRLFFIKRSGTELFKLLFYIADCYLNNKTLNNWDAFKALKYYCTVENPVFMKYYDLLSDETKEEIEEKRKIRAIKEKMKNERI